MAKDPQIAPQVLATMELFVELPAASLAEVAACARVRRVERDVRIFNQGDGGVRAHAVIEGGVRIAQSGSDGAQVIVRFIGPGEMFSTVSLFTEGRYPADAVALAKTLEASWSEAKLLELMGRYPQIAVNVIRHIGQDQRDFRCGGCGFYHVRPARAVSTCVLEHSPPRMSRLIAAAKPFS